MSTIARRVAASPVRTASEAWRFITELLSKPGSDGRSELVAVTGIACSLLADECFKGAPAVVTGSGPQVRVYCIYDEDAIDGTNVNENALSFDATAGDWKMSLPCREEDLDWVTASLKKKSSRITARDMDGDGGAADDRAASLNQVEVNVEGFLNS